MKCETYDDLLTAYKRAVSLYGNAVRGFDTLDGDDLWQASQKAARSRLACRDAYNALTAHRRQHLSSLAAKAGSS